MAFILNKHVVDSTDSVKTMHSGLEHPNIIDVIALDPKTDQVALVMHEAREWDSSDERIWQLQEKVNAYLSFALDGEMNESYPQFAGKEIRLQLDCTTPPDERTLKFIGIVREQIGYQGISFEIRVEGQSGCGCGSATPCDS